MKMTTITKKMMSVAAHPQDPAPSRTKKLAVGTSPSFMGHLNRHPKLNPIPIPIPNGGPPRPHSLRPPT